MNEMRTGVELDALVAEKVMGWRRSTRSIVLIGSEPPYHHESEGWLPLDGSGWRHDVPEYSTDIAAAWEVVEKMASHEDMDEDAFRLRMRYCMNPEHEGSRSDALWEAIFGSDFLGWFRAYAPTAPLAICRAALATTEATVGRESLTGPDENGAKTESWRGDSNP